MFEAFYPALNWNAIRHEWPHSAHSVFVRCGEMRWHVQRMGQGPVLLLLHGTGASTHTWREVMPLLAARYSVIAARRIWETESARDAAVNRRESARQVLITMGMTKEEVDQVLTSGETVSSLPIRSPIDGQVVRFEKVLGEGVVPEETIFEIHDMSRPWAKAFLAEGDAPARLAVPLVNWAGQENSSLTVTIRGLDKVTKVRSVERGELKFAQVKGAIQINLPLNVADMLLIDK